MNFTEIEMLTPKQNGTAAGESGDREAPSSSSSSTGGKSGTKTSIRTMWKKAVKSMKPGDKPAEKGDKAARSESESSTKGASQDPAAASKTTTRQSSLKKIGLIKRKDSKEKEVAATPPADDPEEPTKSHDLDPVFKTLMDAASSRRSAPQHGSSPQREGDPDGDLYDLYSSGYAYPP